MVRNNVPSVWKCPVGCVSPSDASGHHTLRMDHSNVVLCVSGGQSATLQTCFKEFDLWDGRFVIGATDSVLVGELSVEASPVVGRDELARS